jgi:ribosomal protein S18 acetylase RimI-like enzyme
MNPDGALLRTETDALVLSYFRVPWDSEIFGFPVGQIAQICVFRPDRAVQDLATFSNWLDDQAIQLASCRLPHDRLRESMVLEEMGFRFVEMVLHPHLANLQSRSWEDQGLKVRAAEAADLPELEEIAAHAFGYERFHVDPRLDPKLADLRYRVWVRNSLGYERQQLYKICEDQKVVAFFVTESKPGGSCYWHLTAVSPVFQGRGYGKKVWRTMLRHHQSEGATEVGTTIAARNSPVLSLYSSLDFRFRPPEMTLHWVRRV